MERITHHAHQIDSVIETKLNNRRTTATTTAEAAEKQTKFKYKKDVGRVALYLA